MHGDQKFKVLIVGGSIAGLTLAHCLDRAGIDYVVLEKHGDVAPELGASVGIMPNGARILDQLGLFKEVEPYIEPPDLSYVCYPDGFRFSSHYPTILHSRFGYPVSFLRRSQFLKMLYTNLPDKSKVHLLQKMSSVDTLEEGIRIRTSDGTTFDGDLLVGADGVHSSVRSSMWDIANKEPLGQASIQKERNNMTAEYACTFGISSPIPGIRTGSQIACLNDGFSILTLNGKGGIIFWFLIQKLDTKHFYPNIPRFTQADAVASCEKVQGVKVWDEIAFKDLWDNSGVVSMTALDEYMLRTWTVGRMVCIGDSVHKMTPNLGQGANLAIEDATGLTNTIQRLLRETFPRTPTTREVETALATFNKEEYSRTSGVYKSAKSTCRIQARDGLFNRLMGRYFVPYAGDFPAEMAANSIGAACLLECLDPPNREPPYWKKARHEQKSGQRNRLVYIMPALVASMALACWVV